jgi:hypothetical protein
MSAKVDQFCNQLRDRLNALEGQVLTLKTNVRTLPQEGEEALHKCLAETRNRVEAQKKNVEKARARLKLRAEQKVGQVKEAVSQWKAKREVSSLKARAEYAEQYAADAVLMADTAVAEAEEAIIDALIARIDAENAEAPAAAK